MAITPTRRTVVRGAAWSAPVVALASAAPAVAASTACEATYQTVTKTFTFKDVVGQPATVVVTASNVPLVVPNGSTLLPITIDAQTTLSATSSNVLPTLLGGATKIDGTVVSNTTLSGVMSGTVPANLTIPMTTLTNPAVVPASGSSPALTVNATGNGTVTITLQPPVPTLTGYDNNGTKTGGPTQLALADNGGDNVLATFTVIDACA